MKAFHFGGTFKITGSARHPLGDALLCDHVMMNGLDVVDIGASDGSTSVELLSRLNGVRSFTIADLYLRATARRTKRRTFFFDAEDACVLVSGGRLVAWPAMSRTVGAVYWPLIRLARRRAPEEVLLLNPRTREVLRSDPRVAYRVHDIFTTWPGDPPQVIKVANLLRRLYFTDAKLVEGLTAILGSLAPEGHLLLVDNPRIEGIAERAGLYRREEDHFVTVAETAEVPEISDLVPLVRLPC